MCLSVTCFLGATLVLVSGSVSDYLFITMGSLSPWVCVMQVVEVLVSPCILVGLVVPTDLVQRQTRSLS